MLYRLLALICCAGIMVFTGALRASDEPALSISVTLDPVLSSQLPADGIDGRLIIIIGKRGETEPRFQTGASYSSAQIFGQTFDDVKPGDTLTLAPDTFGFPRASLADLPAGDFAIQAVFHRYETFSLATGHTVKLPMNRGAGQNWRLAPGNLVSLPTDISLTGGAEALDLTLDRINPPIEQPSDTKYVRHIKIKSELLSKFWGRDIYLGAHVLLPHGFDENPDMRYPLAIFHGHFPRDFGGFRTSPPDDDLACEYSARFDVDCYNRIQQQEAYDFYQKWISPDFPRMLIIQIQHANPYYDDSYAVNSANLGPYGDAITHELVPYIEKQFNGLGEPWSRFLYGGSTGGWEALAAQVFYPDDYNGAFAACPDPIDFRAYTLVNLYEDDNAYTKKGPFGEIKNPVHRDYLGQLSATIEMNNHYELVLGDKSRSGDQFDIWEAVYSPQGADGYPARIWDKKTGKINPDVAAYWRENYDLRHIMQRDWATLGPKLKGKIHLYVGDMDNFYLNNAVYLAEDFLESALPAYEGLVDYGDRAEHCWNGDHDNPNHISRLRYNSFYVPRILERVKATAPEGADLRWMP